VIKYNLWKVHGKKQSMYYRCELLQRLAARGYLVSWVLFFATVLGMQPSQAEPVADRGPGTTNTRVTQTNNRFDIDGGQRAGRNLFHSFEQFGLSAGEVANFLSSPQIQTILARVTGGNASIINGLIQVSGGNSNLYVMNPAGIVFGASARLNVPAAFVATSATGIEFEAGWFSAIASNTYADLVSEPVGFGVGVTEPGTVVNGGRLSAPQAIALVGGVVINTGRLSAPSITLVAVPREGAVRLSQPGNILSFELQPFTDSQPNRWALPILALPQLLTGGNLQSATGLTVDEAGNVGLTGASLISSQPGSVFVSGTLNASSTAMGQSGGVVQLAGSGMAIVNATITASGDQNGGTVLLNHYPVPGILSFSTVLYQNSTISADSRGNGNGGRVAIAAGGGMNVANNSSISARGGAESGNGGLIQFNTPLLQVTSNDGMTAAAILQTRLDVSAVNGLPGSIDYGRAEFGLLPDINLTPPNLDQDPFVTYNPLPIDGGSVVGNPAPTDSPPAPSPDVSRPLPPGEGDPPSEPRPQPTPTQPPVITFNEIPSSILQDLNTLQLAKPTVFCPTPLFQQSCPGQQEGVGTWEAILKTNTNPAPPKFP
jgi:filamentous hemagglutinin family protein